MFRFDRLIRSDMPVRDVKHQYPSTIPVFAKLGFREICDDCAIRVVAMRAGISDADAVDALNPRRSRARVKSKMAGPGGRAQR